MQELCTKTIYEVSVNDQAAAQGLKQTKWPAVKAFL